MTQTSRGEHQLSSPRAHTIDFGFNERLSVDVRAENVSYIVNPKKMSILHRLGALQLPWEWSDDAVPQQVLEKVSFSVKSGQMLAILGTSGKTASHVFGSGFSHVDSEGFFGGGGGVFDRGPQDPFPVLILIKNISLKYNHYYTIHLSEYKYICSGW